MTHLPLAVPSTQDGISGVGCAVTRRRDSIRTTQLTRIRSLCIVPFKSVRGNYSLHRLGSISWVVLFLFEFFWTVYTCNPNWLTRTHTHTHSQTLHREWTVPHPADSGTGGHSYKCWPSEHMASQHLACPTTQWAEPRYVQDVTAWQHTLLSLGHRMPAVVRCVLDASSPTVMPCTQHHF